MLQTLFFNYRENNNNNLPKELIYSINKYYYRRGYGKAKGKSRLIREDEHDYSDEGEGEGGGGKGEGRVMSFGTTNEPTRQLQVGGCGLGGSGCGQYVCGMIYMYINELFNRTCIIMKGCG